MRAPENTVIRHAVAILLMASPAFADVSCTLRDPVCSDCAAVQVRFTIDAAQFVAPQNPADPPRRQISAVHLGDLRFIAEAIRMEGGVVGFFDNGDVSRLMIVQQDGSARLSIRPEGQPQGRILSGLCRRD